MTSTRDDRRSRSGENTAPAAASPTLRIVDPVRPAAVSGAALSRSPGSTWATRYRHRLEISDVAVITVAVIGAFLTRFGWNHDLAQVGTIPIAHWAVAMLIAVTWIACLAAYHSRDARVVGIGITEYRSVVSASITTFGVLGILFLMFDINVARGFFVLALPTGLIGLMVSRLLWRKWLVRQRKRGRFVSRALVVGDRKDVQYVIGQIDKKAVSVYEVIGAAVDGPETDRIEVNSRSVAVVSNLDSVAKAASRLEVDVVIVAGQPVGGGFFIRDLGWDLEGSRAELVVASRLTNVAGPRIHFRPVEGLPLMHVELPQYSGGKHLLKRAFDMVASGTALVLLFPVLVAIALCVRSESPGPALFRQERVGKGGQAFFMLKFRSMVETAEDDLAGLLDQNEGAGVLFKMKHDPRVTRVGRVLRKYSLDELPQLWNIFRGEMSLVGPRPPLASEVAGYEARVHRRLLIKPGLTGMWQVNGRSNLDWDESVRLDLYYVENWSLTGDLQIMWRTVKLLVNPVGAY